MTAADYSWGVSDASKLRAAEAALSREIQRLAVEQCARVGRVEALVDRWQANCDAVAITYQDPIARERATGWLRSVIRDLRHALDGGEFPGGRR